LSTYTLLDFLALLHPRACGNLTRLFDASAISPQLLSAPHFQAGQDCSDNPTASQPWQVYSHQQTLLFCDIGTSTDTPFRTKFSDWQFKAVEGPLGFVAQFSSGHWETKRKKPGALATNAGELVSASPDQPFTRCIAIHCVDVVVTYCFVFVCAKNG
jgi:hypothetical protein